LWQAYNFIFSSQIHQASPSPLRKKKVQNPFTHPCQFLALLFAVFVATVAPKSKRSRLMDYNQKAVASTDLLLRLLLWAVVGVASEK